MSQSHHLVHCPSKERSVVQDCQRKLISYLVSLDSFKGVVSVTFNAFVNREQLELNWQIVSLLQHCHHLCQNSRVLST